MFVEVDAATSLVSFGAAAPAPLWLLLLAHACCWWQLPAARRSKDCAGLTHTHPYRCACRHAHCAVAGVQCAAVPALLPRHPDALHAVSAQLHAFALSELLLAHSLAHGHGFRPASGCQLRWKARICDSCSRIHFQLQVRHCGADERESRGAGRLGMGPPPVHQWAALVGVGSHGGLEWHLDRWAVGAGRVAWCSWVCPCMRQPKACAKGR